MLPKSSLLSLSVSRWHRTIFHIIILAIVLVFSDELFDARVAHANQPSNNIIYIDGIRYPYTATGIQAAINDVPTPRRNWWCSDVARDRNSPGFGRPDYAQTCLPDRGIKRLLLAHL